MKPCAERRGQDRGYEYLLCRGFLAVGGLPASQLCSLCSPSPPRSTGGAHRWLCPDSALSVSLRPRSRPMAHASACPGPSPQGFGCTTSS